MERKARCSPAPPAFLYGCPRGAMFAKGSGLTTVVSDPIINFDILEDPAAMRRSKAHACEHRELVGAHGGVWFRPIIDPPVVALTVCTDPSEQQLGKVVARDCLLSIHLHLLREHVRPADLATVGYSVRDKVIDLDSVK